MSEEEAAPKRGRKPGFYVYRIFLAFETLYIGKGSGPRLENQMRRFDAGGEILESCPTEEAAFDRERFWIAELKPTLNRNKGGCGGRKRGSSTKELVELANKIGSRRFFARALLVYAKRRPWAIPESKLKILRVVAQ